MKTFPFVLLLLIISLIAVKPSLAHQPFFENNDATFDSPWHIDDITIATAIYATLHTEHDVDYYTFEGFRDQSILVSILVPRISEQEGFAPSLALLGPGFPSKDLPPISILAGSGTYHVPIPEDMDNVFNEPYSGTSYWRRQRERISLPADGLYYFAIFSPTGQIGRYVLSVGDREIPGGDPQFRQKIQEYWTPVIPEE